MLLFAALCAIVAGWVLQLAAPRSPIAPVGAVAQGQAPTDLAAAGRLFGGVERASPAAAAAAPSNIQVAGVLAAGARGVALLAIDGRPAKPYAVGDPVGDGLKLVSVTGDAVELDRGGRALRIAAPPRASIDVLTSGPSRPTAGMSASPAAPVPPSLAAPALAPLPPRALPPAGAAAGGAPPVAVTPSPATEGTAPPPGAPPRSK